MKTRYVKWDEKKGFSPKDLQAAKEIIAAGGLVAFPTETVYGLGGDALCEAAAGKIYAAKGRPSDNPLIVHISKREALEQLVVEIPESGKLLMDTFWPGPLTLIFKKSEKVPCGTTGGLSTVAVRMPNHLSAKAFLDAVEVPIAAPSANTSGRPSPTLASHVKEDLDGRIDMIIDGGQVGIGIESTIVDLTEEIPTILRPGYITKEMLEEVIGEVRMDAGLVRDDVRPKAPGMKYRHYAPKGEMTIFEGETEEVISHINELAKAYSEEEIGILATEETKDKYKKGHVICVGSRKEETVAKELYQALRQFDALGTKVIFSESFSKEPQGEAIMNRLTKAAGHRIIYLSGREMSLGGKHMCEYNRVVFICKENLTQSPMAEWIFRSIIMDTEKEVASKGLVVLFPEPLNPKVSNTLRIHAVPCQERSSEQLVAEDFTDKTLYITMNSVEKIKVAEEFGVTENVYTLKEFVGEEGDVFDPYGSEEEGYETLYTELKDLLYKMKSKLNWT